MTLQEPARRQAVRDLDNLLSVTLDIPAGRIPIDDDRWDQFEARFLHLAASFLELGPEVLAAATSDAFKLLRSTARVIAVHLRDLDSDACAAAMFAHPRREAANAMHATTRRLATAWQGLLIAEGEAERACRGNQAAAVAEELAVAIAELQAWESLPATDPWLSAFGVDRSILVDADGRFSSALLIASFHNRYEQLDRHLKSLFSGLGGQDIGTAKAIGYVSALLGSADPIEVVKVSLHIRGILTNAAQREPERVRSVLGRLHDNVDRSYANSLMVTDTRNRLIVESRPDRRAMLELDLYRRVCEGQVRPWAWALVCLLTGVDGQPPMIQELHDRLRAIDEESTRAFAGTLAAGARNAAAHEDYRWDPRRRRIVGSGGSDFDPDELAAMSYRGLGLMASAELAWALASSINPAVRSPAVSEAIPSVLHALSALNRFGTNNLRPTSWYLDGEGLIVEIAGLTAASINPCAQALIEAAAIIEVDHISVRLPRTAYPVMVATRPVLDASFSMWVHTRRRRPKMPPAVFLPILFQSRLLVETPQQATDAALWLALNEGVHFINDFIERRDAGAPFAASLHTLAEDLWLTSEALRVCAIAAPDQPDLQGHIYRLMRGAHVHARSIVDSPGAPSQSARKSLAGMTEEMRKQCQDLPPCAPLPTVDPATL